MSQVQKRAPMSDEKKKIAAEKRKATMEAKKKAEYQARIEDQRKQVVYKFYEQIKQDHEKRTDELDASEAALKECLAKEKAWFELHKAIHAKYCAELTKTRLGKDLYTAMILPNTGSIWTTVRQTIDHNWTREENNKKDAAFFDSIKHVKNIKYEPCPDPSAYYFAGENKLYWRVTFDLDL